MLCEGDSGLLVPAGDPLALAGALRQLIEDPAQRDRLGEAARRHAEAEFHVAVMADRYEHLYRSSGSGAASG
jgi:rhamnosyl/mannosyltransferase